MEEIIQLLKNIEKRLDSIEEHIGIVGKDCSKINDHITFVETTYNTLRKPFNYFAKKVVILPPLPLLKNNKEEEYGIE